MKRLFLLMLVPVGLILFNNTVFRHQHVLTNGTVIEHAHPFRNCTENPFSGSGHEHSDRELLFFILTTDSPVTLSFSFLFASVFSKSERVIGMHLQQVEISKDNHHSFLLRGPPLCSVSRVQQL